MSATVLRRACSSTLSAKSTATPEVIRYSMGAEANRTAAPLSRLAGAGPGSPLRGDAHVRAAAGSSASMTTAASAREPAPTDPVAVLRSRAYVQLLVVAAVLGVP